MFRDSLQNPKTDVNKRCAKKRCKYVGDVPKAGVSERFARPASNSNPYKNFKASQKLMPAGSFSSNFGFFPNQERSVFKKAVGTD